MRAELLPFLDELGKLFRPSSLLILCGFCGYYRIMKESLIQQMQDKEVFRNVLARGNKHA